MVDLEFLARIPIFADLRTDERVEWAKAIYDRRYQRGSIIFGEGEPGEAAYFVREGRVKIYRISPGGHEQILGLFGPTQPFGLISALDGSPYPASAQATEDSRVSMVRSDQLQRLLAAHPNLMGGVFREVGDRLRSAQGRVHSLASQSVHQRLAEYLLRQLQAAGTPHQDGVVKVRLTMTHQELGSYLGASRETISRALAELRREGSIQASEGDLLTVDTCRLRAWLET